MRPNTSQLLLLLSIYQFLKDVCLRFVCRVLPGDIPVCSCYWNSTPGLRLFLSSNKEDSGVLTFIWMKGALHTKHFHELSANNIRFNNNQVSSPAARSVSGSLKNWKRIVFFFFKEKGKPRWLTAQRESWGMRQIKPESKIVTPTDLKSSPGFFADLQKKRETKGDMQVLLSETASAAPSLPM